MTIGGSGFYVLLWENKRLAYLMIDPGTTARVPSQRDRERAGFYELCNHATWEEMVGKGDPLRALQSACESGQLALRRVMRSPDGRMMAWNHDLSSVTINDEGEGTIRLGDYQIPTVIRFCGLGASTPLDKASSP